MNNDHPITYLGRVQALAEILSIQGTSSGCRLVMEVDEWFAHSLRLKGWALLDGVHLPVDSSSGPTLIDVLVPQALLNRTTLSDLSPGQFVHIESPTAGKTETVLLTGRVDFLTQVVALQRLSGQLRLSLPWAWRHRITTGCDVVLHGERVTVQSVVRQRPAWFEIALPSSARLRTLFENMEAGQWLNVELMLGSRLDE